MNGNLGSPQTETSVPKSPANPIHTKYFYFVAALILLAATFIGFQKFYLGGGTASGYPLRPHIRTLVILHGIVMSAWILLFLVQTVLVANNNRRAHMFMGKIGVVLAICILVSGLKVGVESARHLPSHYRIFGFSGLQFMAFPIISILSYAGFVVIGVWQRRRPEVHAPMMLMGTIMTVGAALFRIEPLNALFRNTGLGMIFGPMIGAVALGLLFLFARCVLTRSFDRWFAAGFAGVAISNILTNQIAGTKVWSQFATWLLG